MAAGEDPIDADCEFLRDRSGESATTIERAAALAMELWRRLKNAEAVDVADRVLTMPPSVRIAHNERAFRIAFTRTAACWKRRVGTRCS